MLSLILIASTLVTVTVAVHASGLALVLMVLRKRNVASLVGFWPIFRLLLLVAWCLILLHVTEILIWGLFYLWSGCMPDVESAIYFSGVTYSSIGYGDLLLAKPWRMLAPIEGLTGILMFGLSTGLFFAVVARVHRARLADTAADATTE